MVTGRLQSKPEIWGMVFFKVLQEILSVYYNGTSPTNHRWGIPGFLPTIKSCQTTTGKEKTGKTITDIKLFQQYIQT